MLFFGAPVRRRGRPSPVGLRMLFAAATLLGVWAFLLTATIAYGIGSGAFSTAQVRTLTEFPGDSGRSASSDDRTRRTFDRIAMHEEAAATRASQNVIFPLMVLLLIGFVFWLWRQLALARRESRRALRHFLNSQGPGS